MYPRFENQLLLGQVYRGLQTESRSWPHDGSKQLGTMRDDQGLPCPSHLGPASQLPSRMWAVALGMGRALGPLSAVWEQLLWSLGDDSFFLGWIKWGKCLPLGTCILSSVWTQGIFWFYLQRFSLNESKQFVSGNVRFTQKLNLSGIQNGTKFFICVLIDL